MFKEKEDKWTRPRGFWEANAGDILMLATALFFLAMTIGGVAFMLLQPRIEGLHQLFSDPPARAMPPPDQKLHLAPGEVEVPIYPGKPVVLPPPPKK